MVHTCKISEVKFLKFKEKIDSILVLFRLKVLVIVHHVLVLSLFYIIYEDVLHRCVVFCVTLVYSLIQITSNFSLYSNIDIYTHFCGIVALHAKCSFCYGLRNMLHLINFAFGIGIDSSALQFLCKWKSILHTDKLLISWIN